MGEAMRVMEVCGTHTMAIARAGLKSALKGRVEFLSGPGCPVCVTPVAALDAALALAEKGVTLASYGDMLRVPGSAGKSLLDSRAAGGQVRMVYSPMDALALARAQPKTKVVFLGVGFETTAPGTAMAVLEAERQGVENFFLLPLLKRVEPALRALCASAGFRVEGFLCPGHVASVTGARAFAFLAEEYRLPAVVAGFEPEDILRAVAMLENQREAGEARLENAYERAVTPEGNPLARAAVERVFVPSDSRWRGLGLMEKSGLALRPRYKAYDAALAFSLTPDPPEPATPCRCAEVLTGRRAPRDCPLFGRCTPETPVGPCMVSGEGACAAAYKYEV